MRNLPAGLATHMSQRPCALLHRPGLFNFRQWQPRAGPKTLSIATIEGEDHGHEQEVRCGNIGLRNLPIIAAPDAHDLAAAATDGNTLNLLALPVAFLERLWSQL